MTGVLPAVPLSQSPLWKMRPVTLRPRLATGLPCSVVGDSVEKLTHNRITDLSDAWGENLSARRKKFSLGWSIHVP
jgi:hypothetical protein